MPRTKNSPASRARHKKWLKRAKGYRGRRNSVFKLAKEAVLKAGQHAFHDRRKKKSVFRARWQTQINGATRANGLSYSHFIDLIRKKNVVIDRKILAEIAFKNPALFSNIVKFVQDEPATTKKPT